jgi:Tfp pilus assembly protein PilO
MNERLRKAWGSFVSQPRQLVLAVTAVLVLAGGVVCRQWIFPAYDRWAALRDEVRRMGFDQERLSRNLLVRPQVDEQLAQLGEAVQQTESDQRTLSQFMVDLESAANATSVALVNARPEPPARESSCQVYRVRLTVSGSLSDILRFVNQVTDGPSAVGLNAVTLRAVQGSQQVESILTLQMARVAPAGQATGQEAGHGGA